MKIIKSSKQLDQMLARQRALGKSVGFVPTMGALHKGHLSLIRASKRENDLTVVSIFVNPTQFGPKEDYKKYPRVFNKDKKLLKQSRVSILFYPSVSEMYPKKEKLGLCPYRNGMKWPALTKRLCGKFRPGHFQGVVTIVTKLLDIVKPNQLYLGAKDYQQAVVLKQLVRDLRMKTQVRIVATVREKDGLAMSSRNRYLSSKDRVRARMISHILFALRADLKARKLSISALKSKTCRNLGQIVDKVQYLEIVDAETLAPLKRYQRKMAAVTACFVGKTRLIDNVII